MKLISPIWLFYRCFLCRLPFILSIAILTLACCHVGAAEKYKESKFDSKKYNNHRITVRQVRPSCNDVTGTLPPFREVSEAAKRFFAALDKLPEGFVKRSGINYVTFLNNPMLKGISVAGLAVGDTMILSLSAREQSIFHELFHIFDLHKKNNSGWAKLNHKKFIYTGSVYYEAKLSKRKRKKKEQNLELGTFNNDFVSSYAMSNELEDRAETFAYMIVEGKRFLQRAQNSIVIKKKMKYIINMTGKRRLIGKDFWCKHFEITKEQLSAL